MTGGQPVKSRQTNLEAEFLPLTVQVLHLLLQQQDIVGDDVLGQIRLHGAQLSQALSPVLQGVLVLLHTITHRLSQETVRDPPPQLAPSQLPPNVSLCPAPFSFSPPLCHSFLSLSPRPERGLKAIGCRPGRGRGGGVREE